MAVHYVETSEIKIKYSLVVNLHLFVISTDITEFAYPFIFIILFIRAVACFI